MMRSVLQDWVMELPLREQGTLLTAVRGCDVAGKLFDERGEYIDTPERRLTAFIRWCFMNPADPREVDMPGAFFQSGAPTFRISQIGHYPLHWYSHVMHALEVIGWRHPDIAVRGAASFLYQRMAYNLHLNPETYGQYTQRLLEDRIAAGNVVS